MGLTSFPNGVSSFGMPVIGAGPVLATGNVFFVHYGTGSNGSGYGKAPSTPYKTIAYAVTQCTASKGDVIFVMPGHTESISAAGTITMSKIGVQVIGLGTGSLRPTLTFGTATTATIAITAAQTSFRNVVFDYTGFDAIATGINITAADAHFYSCRFKMADTTNQAAIAVTLGAGADRARFEDCQFEATSVGATAAINGVSAVDHPTVVGCRFYGEFSTAPVTNATAAWTNVFIDRNHFRVLTSAKPAVSLHASATGFITQNMIACNTISAGGSITATACFKAQNYATDTAANSGILDPTVVTL